MSTQPTDEQLSQGFALNPEISAVEMMAQLPGQNVDLITHPPLDGSKGKTKKSKSKKPTPTQLTVTTRSGTGSEKRGGDPLADERIPKTPKIDTSKSSGARLTLDRIAGMSQTEASEDVPDDDFMTTDDVAESVARSARSEYAVSNLRALIDAQEATITKLRADMSLCMTKFDNITLELESIKEMVKTGRENMGAGSGSMGQTSAVKRNSKVEGGGGSTVPDKGKPLFVAPQAPVSDSASGVVGKSLFRSKNF